MSKDKDVTNREKTCLSKRKEIRAAIRDIILGKISKSKWRVTG